MKSKTQIRRIFDCMLSNGARAVVKTNLHDGYTQVTLWSLLEWEIRRMHPDMDATIIAVNV